MDQLTALKNEIYKKINDAYLSNNIDVLLMALSSNSSNDVQSLVK